LPDLPRPTLPGWKRSAQLAEHHHKDEYQQPIVKDVFEEARQRLIDAVDARQAAVSPSAEDAGKKPTTYMKDERTEN